MSAQFWFFWSVVLVLILSYVTVSNNTQLPWTKCVSLNKTNEKDGSRLYRIYTRPNNANKAENTLSFYTTGDYVGIKSKHDGDAYWICNGNSISFINITWTHTTRGTLRCGISNVLFRNISIIRSPALYGQTPCMSSNAGGPQMNQPNDTRGYNFTVENSFIQAPGDDCIAFFNIKYGKVLNTFIRDGFCRGIFIDTPAQNVCGNNVTIIRDVVLDESNSSYYTCNATLTLKSLSYA